jgi:TonB family protein
MDYPLASVNSESLYTPDSQRALINLHAYGMSVQAAIGPKVLDGGGLAGRVLVAFSLGTDGTLRGARVAQSSGHTSLDNQALQIVGQAAFPSPPSNIATVQRTYVSAFTFT